MGKSRRNKAASVPPPKGDAVVVAPTSPPLAFDFRFWTAPLVVFAGLLVLYIATLAPSITGGDSGELVSAALTGGVPHPPGYPLFAMLARAFAALPLGHSPAWRVNLLSAVSTAAAAGLVCASLVLWTRNTVAALVAAILFGANQVVWFHATAAEIFGLNSFFVALAFLLWLRVEQTDSRRCLYALCFVAGLGMSNQHTFALAALPLLARSFWIGRTTLKARGIAIALGLGLLGLAPYIYLPLASASSAAVSWGDQTTLAGFARHLLRLDYGSFGLGQASQSGAFVDKGTFFPTLWSLLGHGFPRFAWIGLPLALAGFTWASEAQEQRRCALVLGIALGSYLLVFCAFSNMAPNAELYLTEVSRFFIQPDLLFAIAAGLGAAKLLAMLRARWTLLRRQPRLAYAFPAGVLVLCLATNGASASRRGDLVFADFANTVLGSLPRNAVVVSYGDHVSGAISYFHEVEKLRPDVVHLDREMLSSPWYGERKRRLHPDLQLPQGGYGRLGYNIKKLLDGNPTRHLTVIDKLDAWDQSWTDSHKLVTHGLVHSLVPATQYPSFAEWVARDRQAMAAYDVVPALRFPKGTWENAVGQLVLTTQGLRAHIAVAYSLALGRDPPAARVGATLLEDLIAKAGGEAKLGIAGIDGLPQLFVSAPAWRDLGICYEILGRLDKSYLDRVPAAVEKFAEQAAPDNPELPAAKKFLEMRRGRGGRN